MNINKKTFRNFWKIIILYEYMYKIQPAVCKECSLLFENYITEKNMCKQRNRFCMSHVNVLSLKQ